MRGHHLGVVGGLTVGGLLTFWGCVGDEPVQPNTTIIYPEGGGFTPTNPPPGSTAMPPAPPTLDGGRSISCDGVAVCSGSDFCCSSRSNGWVDSTCAGDCGPNHVLACDDSTDCTDGKVCCFVDDGGQQVKRSFCGLPAACAMQQLCNLERPEACPLGICTPFKFWGPSGLSFCSDGGVPEVPDAGDDDEDDAGAPDAGDG